MNASELIKKWQKKRDDMAANLLLMDVMLDSMRKDSDLAEAIAKAEEMRELEFESKPARNSFAV